MFRLAVYRPVAYTSTYANRVQWAVKRFFGRLREQSELKNQ
jgi:hypothetical protein